MYVYIYIYIYIYIYVYIYTLILYRSAKQVKSIGRGSQRSHTKIALEKLKDKKQCQLLKPYLCPANGLDMNPVDFEILELLEQTSGRSRRLNDLDSLKEAFKPRFQRVI